jgi:hypothetical protein
VWCIAGSTPLPPVALKTFGWQSHSTAAGPAWRRSRSTFAIAAGPGHSSTSQWGNGSSALLSGSTSSSSPRPSEILIDLQAIAVGIGEIDAALTNMVGGTLDLDAVF